MKPMTLVLPPDLAYLAAAVQNFVRDIKKQLVHEKQWPEEKDIYLQEAFITMQEKGLNYPPYYPEHEQIAVAPMRREMKQTWRSQAYLRAVDEWFAHCALTLSLGHLTDLMPPSPVFYLNLKD